MEKSPEIIIRIANKRFCAYCGKEIKPDDYKTYRCSCPDAQQALKLIDTALSLEFQAAKLRNQIPQTRFGAKTVCAPIESNPIDDETPDPCV